jgi:hypothetical protein
VPVLVHVPFGIPSIDVRHDATVFSAYTAANNQLMLYIATWCIAMQNGIFLTTNQ